MTDSTLVGSVEQSCLCCHLNLLWIYSNSRIWLGLSSLCPFILFWCSAEDNDVNEGKHNVQICKERTYRVAFKQTGGCIILGVALTTIFHFFPREIWYCWLQKSQQNTDAPFLRPFRVVDRLIRSSKMMSRAMVIRKKHFDHCCWHLAFYWSSFTSLLPPFYIIGLLDWQDNKRHTKY